MILCHICPLCHHWGLESMPADTHQGFRADVQREKAQRMSDLRALLFISLSLSRSLWSINFAAHEEEAAQTFSSIWCYWDHQSMWRCCFYSTSALMVLRQGLHCWKSLGLVLTTTAGKVWYGEGHLELPGLQLREEKREIFTSLYFRDWFSVFLLMSCSPSHFLVLLFSWFI